MGDGNYQFGRDGFNNGEGNKYLNGDDPMMEQRFDHNDEPLANKHPLNRQVVEKKAPVKNSAGYPVQHPLGRSLDKPLPPKPPLDPKQQEKQ